jgi:spoIIIJ-associated protein
VTDTTTTSPDEGELAADYLEELLDIADLDGDIEIEIKNQRTYLTIESEDSDDLRSLSKPDVVQALQELTRLAVQQEAGEFSRLILDIAGSRQKREDELADIVDAAIQQIEDGASQAALPPMSSYERKLVHDIVSERGFHSESNGEGADRHTVITASE